jgi:hypothetical protein
LSHQQEEWAAPIGVMAGLDPAIHPLAKKMDARVKPAHDEEIGMASPRSPLIPAKAGIQKCLAWVPAFAGTSG